MTQVENLSIDTLLKNLTRDHDYGAIITDVNGNLLRRIFAVKVWLLLILMLVACDENSSSDSPQCSSYSLQIQKIAEEIQHDSKITINVEVHNDGKLIEDSSEITLAITCNKHKVVDKKQDTTDGKATFSDITIVGDDFVGQCVASVTSAIIDSCTVEGDPKPFNVTIPSKTTNTGLPPPPELTIGSVIIGQPIDITVPADFRDKIKLQPQEFDKCVDHFLIYHEGDQLTQVLTDGVVITANNGKLEGLVLIKKNNRATCDGGFVLVVGKESKDIPVSQSSQRFNGNLVEESDNKLALSYSGTPPAAIFFTTAGEGNLWTKYTGTMSSPAISTLAYSQSSSAALVKSNSGNWSYIGN